MTSKVLYDSGAKFVAATSSGPTTYTIVDSEKTNINDMKNNLKETLGNDCEIITSEINNLGFEIKNL